jgi:1-acyl-sn-glycerol-3-phosphate acyltransferase
VAPRTGWRDIARRVRQQRRGIDRYVGRAPRALNVLQVQQNTALNGLGHIVGAAAAALLPDRTSFDTDRLDLRDPDLIARVMPVLRAFTRSYCGLRVEGLANLPREPVLYVGNHNGGIAGPDLLCTLGTLWETLGPSAPVYAMAHDFAMRQLRPLGRFVQRFGGLRASPANAVRVLDAGGQILVYPGGDLEAYRHAARCDEIVLGARTGFIRIARETGVPIVPIVAHGAHRSAYVFHEGAGLARLLGLKRWARLERFPFALALPWGLAIGPWLPYLPLPFTVRLRVLPAISADSDEPPRWVQETIRRRMQEALTDLAAGARGDEPTSTIG